MAITIGKVKEWYTDESRWNKGAYYKDIKGKEYAVVPGNIELKSCCLLGAVRMCYNDLRKRSEVIINIQTKIKTQHYKNIFLWNDSESTTFNDVKKLVEELDI